ncbi:MAG: hypothetical protein LBR27_11745 [Bifidobacteriaceae bacterium]|jgi:beta-mannosidase|nr:hypothetical protein [Bifidobacteriaceae bacterium]
MAPTSTALQTIPLGSRPWRLALAGGQEAQAKDPAHRVPSNVAAALAEGPLPATVPGCVHDDLLRAGLIEDPYLGLNEAKQHWIGRQAWVYRTTLPTPKELAAAASGAERIDLVADGLDTLATISLNGAQVAKTANMHRGYRFDITEAAQAGGPSGAAGAELSIAFASVYPYAAELAREVGPLPGVLDQPYAYVRKMACNFGWDWGPTVVTAGIWRDLRLEAWSGARLASVRPTVTVDLGNLVAPAQAAGRVEVRVVIERTLSGEGRPFKVRATVAGVSAEALVRPGAAGAAVTLELPQVDLWYPHHHGPQNLYELQVELIDAEAANAIGHWSRQIGFRAVELDTSLDQTGRAFTFKVNGRPIFARGFNWIPNDPLVSRVIRADYEARLADAVAAGADLIRVWGGGIYENEAFYETCDRLGLLVWQDFLFACSAYAETPACQAEIEAEARHNVERLMPHPSLVLWNGNNENIWGHEEWGWTDVIGDGPWGLTYYLDLLPRVVAEVDPTRPYWPGSPYSGVPGVPVDAPDYGCHHSWEVWNRQDYPVYADDVPRFVSEFGWCGPATWRTMAEAIGPEEVRPDGATFQAHNKAEAGPAKLDQGLAWHFREAKDAAGWYHLALVNQARAVQFGIDHWRSHWPRSAGAVVWQLNDCWPVASWAAVDVAGRRKPVWFAIREAFADRRAALVGQPGEWQLALSNLGSAAWQPSGVVRRVGFDGAVLASFEVAATVEPGTVTRLDLPAEVLATGDQARELVVADVDGGRTVVSSVPDAALDYPAPVYAVEVVAAGEGTTGALVRVTAQTLVRDLLLQADRLGPGAASDRGPVTLLPGETAEWHLTGLDHLPLPTELAAPVLLSVAQAQPS